MRDNGAGDGGGGGGGGAPHRERVGGGGAFTQWKMIGWVGLIQREMLEECGVLLVGDITEEYK